MLLKKLELMLSPTGVQGKEMIRHVFSLLTIIVTVLCHVNYIILTDLFIFINI